MMENGRCKKGRWKMEDGRKEDGKLKRRGDVFICRDA